jgi:hypothetical protein
MEDIHMIWTGKNTYGRKILVDSQGIKVEDVYSWDDEKQVAVIYQRDSNGKFLVQDGSLVKEEVAIPDARLVDKPK